jgi:RNA polymerase sigma factor for flagellar operon FliA
MISRETASRMPELENTIGEKEIGGNNLTDVERQQLMMENYKQVEIIAKNFCRGRNLPPNITFDDLIDAGTFGLVDAAQKFDPKLGVKFKTYAEDRIIGEMWDSLRDVDELGYKVRSYVNKVREFLRDEQKKDPDVGLSNFSDSELAAILKLSDPENPQINKRIKMVSKKSILTVRLILEKEKAMSQYTALLDYKRDFDPEETARNGEKKRLLRQVLQRIKFKDKRGKRVIQMYYLDEMTDKAIGKIEGVTQSRITQIRCAALLELRRYFFNKGIHAKDLFE